MRITDQTYDRLLSFASVHQAVRTENLFVKAGISALAIPTPREVDVSCGQSLLFYAADQEKVFSLLAEKQVQWSKLFSRDAAARVYEKLREFVN